MKHLKSYKLFESSTRPESSNQEIDYDRLYSDINDICQDVIDDGLEVKIDISDYKKVDNALCTDVVFIGIHIPSENFLTDKGSFVYGDIKETFDRIIDYLKMFGYDNHKFKVFNFGGNPLFKDFDGDIKESSSSFRLILYKSIDHIIESNDDSDVMARYQLFDTDATISFNFDKKDITDPESIKDLIRVYKKTYNGWGGGPENQDFIDYFNMNYDSNATRKAWYPTINLSIHTVNYGDMIIGFGLKDKKQKLMNWGSLSTNTSGEELYNNKVVSEISKYVRDEITNKQLTIDETIELLNLNVNHKIDWDWETGKILESKKVSNLKFNKQPRKKGAKTDVYNVVKNGNIIGQVKWYSRLRGYGFLPPSGDESEVKEFVKEISRLRREEKKKNK